MKKIYNNLKLFLIVLTFLIFGLSSPISVAAAPKASLYLTPSSGTHVINSTFTVTVKVNSDAAPVNAMEGVIAYDANVLDVVNISTGGSIIKFWLNEPTDNGSSIRFGGGLPSPGYTGAGGTIFSITFRGVKNDKAQLSFSSGAVTANDGKGTNILASMGSASYIISAKVIPPANPPSSKKTIEKKPTVVERVKPQIISVTHPDQEKWYKNKNAQFEWKIPKGVSGVSFLLNSELSSNPGNKSDGMMEGKEFSDLADGIQYLHVKFKDKEGWGTIAHYKIQVDNSAPLPFEINVKKEDGEDWPLLTFTAEDELSGISAYIIIIDNLSDQTIERKPEDPTFRVSGLEVGEHAVLIKAVDVAGNETYAEQKFYINSIETPIIVNYPSEMTSSDSLYLSGTALANVEIKIFVQKEGTLITKTTKSDQDGNWFIINKDKLSNGSYIAWAQATNANGLTSENSVKIGFLVSPPIFTRIGDFIVNYFTVFVSLLFLILLIIIFFIFLFRFAKKRLRKEATEIEVVLKENIKELRKEIEKDFDNMRKGRSSISQKKLLEETQEALKIKIDIMEKKTMKEIRDVEDLA